MTFILLLFRSLCDRFDARRPGDPPRLLDQYNRPRMLASETRLSRPFHDGFGWVLGASIVDNRTRQQREYGEALFQSPLTGVTNRITELTGYGEATVEIMPGLGAAGGPRLSPAGPGGRERKSGGEGTWVAVREDVGGREKIK